MAAVSTELPLIAIVGPTASGKTSLAISLARRYGGEIICADSRTVYRGMDIGTAKPTLEEQSGVRHWGLDMVEPGESFTAAQFQRFAVEAIKDIRGRDKVPFLVGGTGLYVDAVLFEYGFDAPVDVNKRARLESMSLEELTSHCIKNNIPLPENKNNKRYVVRAIERKSVSVKRRDLPVENSIIVGITTEKAELRTRILVRAEQMLTNGVVEEAKLLGEIYGWSSEAMTGNVYPLVGSYLRGELSREELIKRFAISDWQLAKRQLTWLRRSPYTVWLTSLDAEHYLAQKLAQAKNS